MSLLDYYRQFEGMSEEEVNLELREEAAERRRKALTRVPTLDLSQTTWPELTHSRVVQMWSVSPAAIAGVRCSYRFSATFTRRVRTGQQKL